MQNDFNIRRFPGGGIAPETNLGSDPCAAGLAPGAGPHIASRDLNIVRGKPDIEVRRGAEPAGEEQGEHFDLRVIHAAQV